jgi:hypothetical protein
VLQESIKRQSVNYFRNYHRWDGHWQHVFRGLPFLYRSPACPATTRTINCGHYDAWSSAHMITNTQTQGSLSAGLHHHAWGSWLRVKQWTHTICPWQKSGGTRGYVL